MTNDVKSVAEILKKSKHTVFFGGAGMSTDSGIPDFRGTKGMYRSGESNEYYLSNECLEKEPCKFFDFFRKNMVFPDAMPNKAHKALAEMEQRGTVKSVITQNIDGLHQKAGSQRVIELHGTTSRYYCTKCRTVYGDGILQEQQGVPVCSVCGGVVRPDVTLYGEALDGFNFADAQDEVSKADVLIVGGSSLVVTPAASLINCFKGEHLIIINYSPTPYDQYAEYLLRDSVSEVLNYLAEAVCHQ